MTQLRFNIGVPRAGSAAREAEAAREQFRSVLPQAGSAARQAEEERRRSADGARPSGRMTTLHMRGVSQAGPARVSSTFAPTEREPGNTAAQAAAVSPFGLPAEQTVAGTIPPASAPDAALATNTLPERSPLQTAAAKFKSLFRSVLPRAASEN